jgi:hypothetical protein
MINYTLNNNSMKKIFLILTLTWLATNAISQPVNPGAKQTKGKDSVRLKLVNIDDVEKNKSKGHPLIYMSGSQWKDFIKDAIIEKNDTPIDSSAYSFKVVPLGDDPVEFGVILFAKPCPPGCKEDRLGFCQCDLNPSLVFCNIQGQPGYRHCGGLCFSNRTCRMFVRYSSNGCFTRIIAGCRCE